jgi:hypothetical protein
MGGSIFWKTREIGLPSYNDLSTVEVNVNSKEENSRTVVPIMSKNSSSDQRSALCGWTLPPSVSSYCSYIYGSVLFRAYFVFSNLPSRKAIL